jgi:hypothetical protein
VEGHLLPLLRRLKELEGDGVDALWEDGVAVRLSEAGDLVRGEAVDGDPKGDLVGRLVLEEDNALDDCIAKCVGDGAVCRGGGDRSTDTSGGRLEDVLKPPDDGLLAIDRPPRGGALPVLLSKRPCVRARVCAHRERLISACSPSAKGGRGPRGKGPQRFACAKSDMEPWILTLILLVIVTGSPVPE